MNKIAEFVVKLKLFVQQVCIALKSFQSENAKNDQMLESPNIHIFYVPWSFV